MNWKRFATLLVTFFASLASWSAELCTSGLKDFSNRIYYESDSMLVAATDTQVISDANKSAPHYKLMYKVIDLARRRIHDVSVISSEGYSKITRANSFGILTTAVSGVEFVRYNSTRTILKGDYLRDPLSSFVSLDETLNDDERPILTLSREGYRYYNSNGELEAKTRYLPLLKLDDGTLLTAKDDELFLEFQNTIHRVFLKKTSNAFFMYSGDILTVVEFKNDNVMETTNFRIRDGKAYPIPLPQRFQLLPNLQTAVAFDASNGFGSVTSQFMKQEMRSKKWQAISPSLRSGQEAKLGDKVFWLEANNVISHFDIHHFENGIKRIRYPLPIIEIHAVKGTSYLIALTPQSVDLIHSLSGQQITSVSLPKFASAKHPYISVTSTLRGIAKVSVIAENFKENYYLRLGSPKIRFTKTLRVENSRISWSPKTSSNAISELKLWISNCETFEPSPAVSKMWPQELTRALTTQDNSSLGYYLKNHYVLGSQADPPADLIKASMLIALLGEPYWFSNLADLYEPSADVWMKGKVPKEALPYVAKRIRAWDPGSYSQIWTSPFAMRLLASSLSDLRHFTSPEQMRGILETLADQIKLTAGQKYPWIFASKIYHASLFQLERETGLRDLNFTDVVVDRKSLQAYVISNQIIDGNERTRTPYVFYMRPLVDVAGKNATPTPGAVAWNLSAKWRSGAQPFTARIQSVYQEKFVGLIDRSGGMDYSQLWKDKQLTGMVVIGENLNGIKQIIMRYYREYFEDQGFSFDSQAKTVNVLETLKDLISSGQADYFIKEAHSDSDDLNLFRIPESAQLYRGTKKTPQGYEVIYLIGQNKDQQGASSLISNDEFAQWIETRIANRQSKFYYLNASCSSYQKAVNEYVALGRASTGVTIIATNGSTDPFSTYPFNPLNLLLTGLRKGQTYEKIKQDFAILNVVSEFIFPNEARYQSEIIEKMNFPQKISIEVFDGRGKPYFVDSVDD